MLYQFDCYPPLFPPEFLAAGPALYPGLQPLLPSGLRGGRAHPVHPQYGLLHAGGPGLPDLTGQQTVSIYL